MIYIFFNMFEKKKNRNLLKIFSNRLKKLYIIIDKSLSRFEYVYGAAGHPDCIFKINYLDLIKLTKGTEKEITE